MKINNLSGTSMILTIIKIFLVKILTLSACVLVFCNVSHSQIIQDGSNNKPAIVTGEVIDYGNAPIEFATIVIEGTRRFEVMTSLVGSYSVELPPDIYRFSLDGKSFGLLPTRRSPVHLESNSKTEMNFTLFGFRSVYLSQALAALPAGVYDHPFTGEFQYEEISPASLRKGKVKEIGIRYGEKKQVKTRTIYTAEVTGEIEKYNGSDYPGVLLTHNLLTVQAQKITIDSKGKITAEGNVSIEENGKKRKELKVVKLKIDNDTLIIKSEK